MKASLKKGFFNCVGSFFLVIGILGVFLPLLPATPFLLLAGFCFSKGSPTFHQWLVTHKYLGPPVKDWEERGVISKSNKIIATLMLMVSALVMLPNPKIPIIGKASFVLMALGLLTFFWSRPSK